MLLLLLAALLWLGLHLGLAGTRLRDPVAARLGEAGFRIGFSLASAAALALLILAWRRAETLPLWSAPGWLRWVLAFAMLPAFILFAASLTAPNPTAIGGGGLRAGAARGIQRVTRHPMLCAIGLWATLHLIANGDTASLLFFGTLLLTVLAGMPSLDAKLARRAPEAWAPLVAATSILPFGAILAGRNRLALREIGWLAPLLGLLAWAAILHLHPRLFGAPVLLAAS
ncbi:NnrU protein [Siccirubricoccus sp. KC 17139]|uniref:NnrU protein n=1 Tax=Siccirubricoccus soli TaxID=2899147 RepID=A0ABT1D5Y7_9PROT|nr:NnrU family protein [Siccirubricoccus soli]MCO6417342.1 NnrU protein [Siccirubricoccus soli]MCP2683477.1 NnrU protein [Siccirubricoccus soli]